VVRAAFDGRARRDVRRRRYTETLQLDHSGYQLQLDQIIGLLADVEQVDLFGLPLFQMLI
jgi:hypothetical protein